MGWLFSGYDCHPVMMGLYIAWSTGKYCQVPVKTEVKEKAKGDDTKKDKGVLDNWRKSTMEQLNADKIKRKYTKSYRRTGRESQDLPKCGYINVQDLRVATTKIRRMPRSQSRCV